MTRLATAAFVVFLCCLASGQEQFEVASVRKVTNNEGRVDITFAPERFEALMPLRAMVPGAQARIFAHATSCLPVASPARSRITPSFFQFFKSFDDQTLNSVVIQFSLSTVG